VTWTAQPLQPGYMQKHSVEKETVNLIFKPKEKREGLQSCNPLVFNIITDAIRAVMLPQKQHCNNENFINLSQLLPTN